MYIQELLTVERCLLGGQASSRKKALQLVANLIVETQPDHNAFDLLKAMMARERISSTAIGDGIALPHARLESFENPVAALITFDQAIDFDAPDKEDIHIVFALIAPADLEFDQIKGLDEMMKMFKDKTFYAQFKNAHNNEALYEIFNHAMDKYLSLDEKTS